MSDSIGADQRETGRGRRLRSLRRSLIGLSAAGAGAAMLITSAASGVPAAGAAESSSAGAPGAVTATASTSQASGNLTLTVKYVRERHGRIKLTSVTYAGGAHVTVRHPGLVVTFSPAGAFAPQRQTRRPPGFLLVFRVKISSAGSFSGSLPAKVLATANRIGSRRRFPAFDLLSATLASLPKPARRRQISILPVVQAGVLITPF